METIVLFRRLLLLTMIALLAGCFFETRDPPPPELGGGCEFEFEFNDSWERVLFNMEGALECGDASEYMKVISQTFLYLPSNSVQNNYPEVFAGPWATAREQLFINKVFEAERYRANLNVNEQSVDDQGAIIIVTTSYEIQQVDSDGIDNGPLYTDEVIFRFENFSGLVILSAWEDTDNLLAANPFGNRRGDDGGGV